MEKPTINPKNAHDRYFQYPATVALNYEESIYIYIYIYIPHNLGIKSHLSLQTLNL